MRIGEPRRRLIGRLESRSSSAAPTDKKKNEAQAKADPQCGPKSTPEEEWGPTVEDRNSTSANVLFRRKLIAPVKVVPRGKMVRPEKTAEGSGVGRDIQGKVVSSDGDVRRTAAKEHTRCEKRLVTVNCR